MGLREDKRRRLRAALYEASLARFRDQGFDATTVAEVVEAVGVSEPTFFNYFPTKAAVLDQYALGLMDRFAGVLEDHLSRGEPARVTLAAHLAQMAEAYAADPAFMRTVVTRSRLFWGSAGDLRSGALRLHSLLAEAIDRGQEAGDLRTDLDAGRTAETLTGASMLTIINWLVGWWPETDDLGDRLAEQLDLLTRGWAARP